MEALPPRGTGLPILSEVCLQGRPGPGEAESGRGRGPFRPYIPWEHAFLKQAFAWMDVHPTAPLKMF